MKADVVAKRVVVEVMLDVVRIELHCGDSYAAQILHDDICERMKSGQGVTLSAKPTLPQNEKRDAAE